jgi:hypothetical protein
MFMGTDYPAKVNLMSNTGPGTGYSQLEWRFSMTGDPDDYFCTMGTLIESSTATNIPQVAFDAWVANVLPVQSDQLILKAVEFKSLNAGGGAGTSESWFGNGTAIGGYGGGVLPQNCALLVRKVTGLTGRKHRGRMYVPGILHEDFVSNTGLLTNAAWGALVARFNQLLIDLADVQPVVNHKSDPGLAATPITRLDVQQLIATQRRRLR